MSCMTMSYRSMVRPILCILSNRVVGYTTRHHDGYAVMITCRRHHRLVNNASVDALACVTLAACWSPSYKNMLTGARVRQSKSFSSHDSLHVMT